MDLSEDIRLKVEKHGEKDIILDVMKSLQDDGVMITEDVYEAIDTSIYAGNGRQLTLTRQSCRSGSRAIRWFGNAGEAYPRRRGDQIESCLLRLLTAACGT